MRAEKGYIIVGQDTDGTMTPADAGLEWAIGKAKKDFVGKRSLTRPDMVVANRKQLVGLFTDDPQSRARGGRAGRRQARRSQGDRPCDLGLSEPGARPLDRARGGRGGPLADGQAARRAASATPPSRRHGDRPRFLRQTGDAPRWLSALRSCGPLDGVALPDERALHDPPRASRGAFHPARLARGRRARRANASAPRPRTTPRRASEAGGRAALWLGPDEWLLIAEGRSARGARRRDLEAALGDHAAFARRCLAAPDRTRARRAPSRRARSAPAARSISTSAASRSARRRARCSRRRRSCCGGAGRSASISRSGARSPTMR